MVTERRLHLRAGDECLHGAGQREPEHESPEGVEEHPPAFGNPVRKTIAAPCRSQCQGLPCCSAYAGVVIKYLGSKRLLASVLGDIATAAGARTALDLFTGTTRVAQEFKRRGIDVTAVDSATYAEVLAQCYIATDATAVDKDRLAQALDELERVARCGRLLHRDVLRGVTVFPAEERRARRCDARRHRSRYSSDPLYPVLLTALMLAADRVDSTTGLQMAYLKQWAARALQRHRTAGAGVARRARRAAMRGDAMSLIDVVPHVDLAYLDPPYNQHSLLHELPRVGDAGALGRTRALRHRVQADRCARRRDALAVQRQGVDAGRAAIRHLANEGGRRGGVVQRRVVGDAGGRSGNG